MLQSKQHERVTLRAMGHAMARTVEVAEMVKRRVGELHQVTTIGSQEVTDAWEPREQGLDRIEVDHRV
eukprot:CAMPEP_0198348920 /NCGR_PEP_ID=MMETSP1450-20131203/91789_1 /TAXON_ID=753684 ORGANISM="Madagascaria erythrocladiodes, Strain CCMP3234" /NCGR_SAMPLE_ID=MMETSP1450 /ASSEMBLY_ACC=CAM_ASM_001115 /LENGTH=67 /DNA_ID=CAMNT_0044054565 /DNA_START=77 /DNA_END=277 /DNA_ORIENTATION=-